MTMTYICNRCNKLGGRSHCCGPTVPYTGGQGYKRADGSYSWRFFVEGNQRAKGTDRFDTIKEAVADFIDIFTYTPSGEKL